MAEPGTASKTWLVTGCSSGIGRNLAEQLVDRGYRVAVTARQVAQVEDIERRAPDRVIALPLDVRSQESVQSAIDIVIARFGAIDVLVNNAGAGLVGAIEEVSDADVDRVFGTNVFGTLRVIQTVLPHMRERRSGHIVTVTSVGAFRGSAAVGIYNGSKHALNGICEALAAEVRPLGIKVTIVEPGLVKTDFRYRGIARAERRIADYDVTCGVMRDRVEQPFLPETADPGPTAAAMIVGLELPNPPLHLPLTAECLRVVREKLASLEAEVDAMEHIALMATAEPAGASA